MTVVHQSPVSEMTGLALLQLSMTPGFRQPEMAKTTGFHVSSVEEGRVVLACNPEHRHLNHLGVVHGGWAMTVLDAALGVAVQSTLPAGKLFTTLETKVNMVGAIQVDIGKMRCEAQAVHVGGRTGTAEAKLLGPDGKLYAHGSSTCLIMKV